MSDHTPTVKSLIDDALQRVAFSGTVRAMEYLATQLLEHRDSLPKPEISKGAQWLPAIGETVVITCGIDRKQRCTVIGYEVWTPTGPSEFDHRILVHVVYEGTTTSNARHLHEVERITESST